MSNSDGPSSRRGGRGGGGPRGRRNGGNTSRRRLPNTAAENPTSMNAVDKGEGSHSPNSSGGRGGGRGGRARGRRRGRGGSGRGRHVEDGSEDPSRELKDEDVLIAFMPHLRANDPEAKRIHLEHMCGGDVAIDQQSFLEAARKFLSEQNQPKQQQLEHDTNNTQTNDTHAVPNLSAQETKITNSTSLPNAESAIPHPNTSKLSCDNIPPSEDLTNTATLHLSDNTPAQAPTPIQDSSPKPSHLSPPSISQTSQALQRLALDNSPEPPPPSANNHNDLAHADIDKHAQAADRLARDTDSALQDVSTNSKITTKDAQPPTAPAKREWPAKRVLTRLDQQPGKILANGLAAAAFNGQSFLPLGPRQEFVAKWILPLSYLRQRTVQRLEQSQGSSSATQNITIRDALRSLTVGLFRRGCTENGSYSSIISKEVVSSEHSSIDNNPQQQNHSEYHFEIDHASGTIWGTVPFYTPRTPGNVVLRLYFENDTVTTLATGPCIRVCVDDTAVEPTLRFILSNFKSKKGTTNFSSLHSLAYVLEQFTPSQNTHNRRYHSSSSFPNRTVYDSAGRAAWGCICESRKVLDFSWVEYKKRRDKLQMQEKHLTEASSSSPKEETAQSPTENASHTPPESNYDKANEDKDGSRNAEENDDDSKAPLTPEQAKEKTNAIMAERASNERKWREIQSAFASVLRAVLFNSASQLLLKRDVITKLRLEYELWCPLCESFAPNPFANKESLQSGDDNKLNSNDTENNENSPINNNFPHSITFQHFQKCAESRSKMQLEVLGFVPKTNTVHQLFSPSQTSSSSKPGKASASSPNERVQNLFSDLSSSMKRVYAEEYNQSSRVQEHREHVRVRLEQVVTNTGIFPSGTRVTIFGSSANGFGSPKSDLDMCLQLPPSTSIANDKDNGIAAMTKLADELIVAGMRDVDTVRLTARIPVLKFNYPIPVQHDHHGTAKDDETTGEDDVVLLECDISMQNPLACLNTSLLLTYSKINKSTRILASIIKRWAKHRDINNPSRHTLSSYGYIIMLLHFLTFHKAISKTQIVSIISHRDHNNRQPLLPNLQWVDHRWVQSPNTTPYNEATEKLRTQYCLMRHPTESNFVVNAHFSRLDDSNVLSIVQRKFSGADNNNKNDMIIPSVGVLLASFFRYYAYEFDFKKYVVSLNSTASHGLQEKEAKGENDGWSLHRQILSIEDPFETFYDVAHVLKASSFQRIKREFALSYSKMVDAAIGNNSRGGENITGMELIDWMCESISNETSLKP